MCQIEEEELTREKWDILVKMVRERKSWGLPGISTAVHAAHWMEDANEPE